MRDFDPTASEFISSGYLERSGRKYDPVSIISAVAPSIIGGMMGSDASSSAADAQGQSAKEANALNKYIFDTQRGDNKQIYDQQRNDQQPFRQAGLTAQNRLMTLLGLGGAPGGASGRPMTGTTGPYRMRDMARSIQGPGGPPNQQIADMQARGMSTRDMMLAMGENPDQMVTNASQGQRSDGAPNMLQNSPGTHGTPTDMNLRAQLLPQFTKQGPQEYVSVDENGNDVYGYRPGKSTVDETGLQSAMQSQQPQQAQSQQPQQGEPGQGNNGAQYDAAGNQMSSVGGIDSSAPEYGSLMKDFTREDFNAGMDPGYQWRQEQGNKGLERANAASGGLQSGAAMKGAMEYNQGLASQEYGAAFNRFQTNRSNKLNPLQSLMGAGQTSTNQVGQAGQNYGNALTSGAQNYGNQASANITGAGNARASGYLSQGNNWQNAINGGVSAWRNSQPNTLSNSMGFGSGSNYGNQDLGLFL